MMQSTLRKSPKLEPQTTNDTKTKDTECVAPANLEHQEPSTSKQWITPNKNPDGDNKNRESSPPTTSTSSPNKTNLYQELLEVAYANDGK